MAEITLRVPLGRPLTYQEVDDNFRSVQELTLLAQQFALTAQEASTIADAAKNEAIAAKDEALVASGSAASDAQRAEDAADRAEAIAGFDGLHNTLAGRDVPGAHDASAISYEYKTVEAALDDSVSSLKKSGKKILLDLPMAPEGYEDVFQIRGVPSSSVIGAQGFCVDDREKELWIVFNIMCVAVYDLVSGAHKTTFIAGSGTSNEGCVLIYKEDGTRELILRDSDKGGDGWISVYDVTTLPQHLTILTEKASFDVDLHFQMSARGGMLYVEQSTPMYRYTPQLRNLINVFDIDDLGSGPIRQIQLKANENTSPFSPKRQGFSVGDGGIVCSYGGYSGPQTNSKIDTLQGIRLFSYGGDLLKELFVDHKDFIDKLNDLGYPCAIIENEGVFVSESGAIYTLWLTQPKKTSRGMLLVKEFDDSNSKNSISFSDVVGASAGFIPDNGIYRFASHPLEPTKAINPSTGAVMSSMTEMMDFMIEFNIPYATYDSTSLIGVVDFAGNSLGTSRTVELFNRNNASAVNNFCRISSSNLTYDQNYSGTIRSNFFRFNVSPYVDNTYNIGASSLRWKEVFSVTGTINTSDEREKQQQRDLSLAEKASAQELKTKLKAFKWNDAVDKKGADARWHFGVMAQEVKGVFERHGLNAHDYGLFCYDEWQETPEIKEPILDDDGNETGEYEIIQEYEPAGNRYGVRYDQLLAFIISAL